MISIGAIIGGIALVAGGLVGYSLYTNRGKISSATGNIITGVESSLTRVGQKSTDFTENLIPTMQKATVKNPFASMFDSWFSAQSKLAGKTVVYEDNTQVYIPPDNTVNADGTVSGSPPTMDLGDSARQDALDAFNKNREKNAPGFKAGIYYLDYEFAGQKRQWDTQVKLSAYDAERVSRLGNQKNLQYIGQSYLTNKGFTTFGKSKGYL